MYSRQMKPAINIIHPKKLYQAIGQARYLLFGKELAVVSDGSQGSTIRILPEVNTGGYGEQNDEEYRHSFHRMWQGASNICCGGY
jgi:hypothetical protein